MTYSLSRSTITAFSTASQTFFQTISFRSGIQGNNALNGIVNSSVSLTYSYNTISNPMRPRTGKEYTVALQAAGLWGNVRYISPELAYKRFIPMHYLRPSDSGRNVLGIRAQLGYVQGFGGDVAPPQNRFYAGGENEIRGFDVRSSTPYGYVPTRVNFQLTNPDGQCVQQYPGNTANTACVQVPLPVYGIASIGGDASFTTNIEYRIPIAGPVMFSIFDDFNLDVATNKDQLKQSIQGYESLTSGLYGCQTLKQATNSSGEQYCESTIKGSSVGFRRDIRPITGTNFVPRMSLGGELSVIMPIVNAPFRLYYAYNPLRLYERPYCNDGTGVHQSSCSGELITRSMFPVGGAGDYTYAEAIQAYGARDVFREPRKTFRLTISTTF
jgi:outer membrane protein insertion porin family